MDRNDPIIIIGMHRSGTTLLSSILEHNGVCMGKRKESNNESHFFLKLNEKLIGHLGFKWYDLYGFNHSSFNKNAFTFLQKHIFSKNLKRYFGDCEYWGWKDPRTTLFVKEYLEIFPNAKVIHIVRNPIDVSNSLIRRQKNIEVKNLLLKFLRKSNNMIRFGYTVENNYNLKNHKKNLELWRTYVQAGLESKKSLVIRYEDLILSPDNTILKISEFLGLKINFDETVLRSGRAKKGLIPFKKEDEIFQIIPFNLLESLGY